MCPTSSPLANFARLTIAAVLATTTISCVPRPKQDYSIEQLAGLDSIKELMHVQAAVIDHLFAKKKQTSFSDSELQEMVHAAQKITVTSQVLRDRLASRYDPRFGGFATQLHESARELRTHAEAKQAEKIGSTLEAMRLACKGCHGIFK